jgi:hypothetical protein
MLSTDYLALHPRSILCGWAVDGNGSESCPVMGIGCCVDSLVSAVREFQCVIRVLMEQNVRMGYGWNWLRTVSNDVLWC